MDSPERTSRGRGSRYDELRTRSSADVLLDQVRFVLDCPGVARAVRAELAAARGSGAVELFDTLVGALTERSQQHRVRREAARSERHLSAGDVLAALADAGGDLAVDDLPAVPGALDALRDSGLVRPIAGGSYDLTADGWRWCEQAADLETRVRSICRGIEMDGLYQAGVSLADVRDELSRGAPVTRPEVDDALVALAQWGVVSLLADPSVGDDAAVELHGRARHRIIAHAGAPRLMQVADPLRAPGEGEGASVRDRLQQYADGVRSGDTGGKGSVGIASAGRETSPNNGCAP